MTTLVPVCRAIALAAAPADPAGALTSTLSAWAGALAIAAARARRESVRTEIRAGR
jgi:hypothetical protein